MIEKIKSGLVTFRIYDRLHAKIYVFDHSVILGSANFSKNGLTRQYEANLRTDVTQQRSFAVAEVL